MKKLWFLGLFISFSFLTHGQVIVNGVNINDLDIQYIEMHAPVGLGGQVRINYGQVNSNLWTNFDPLTDPAGAPFRNTIAALNFLYQNGWDLVPPVTRWGQDEVSTYLLRKKEAE